MEILAVGSEFVSGGEFEEVIKRSGHRLKSVSTGAEALKKSRKRQIDVLLLDSSSPDIKGYALIAEIKKKFPQSKIIVTVESNFDELEYADKDEKIDYYLIKPLDKIYFENIINHISEKLDSDAKGF